MESEKNKSKVTPTKSCEICGDTMDLKVCSACREVSYCSPAHQREHWKIHKENCKPLVPYKIQESAKALTTKECIAGRDYEKGAIIFEELPIFHYNCPGESFRLAQCVTCGVIVENKKKCSLCTWPVCSEECEKAPLHVQNECRVFLENEIYYPPGENEGKDFEMIARAFSLRCQMSNIWNEILDIMPLFFLDEFNSMKDVITNVFTQGKSVTPIKSIFPQFKFEYEPIVKDEIQAQITVLARRVGFLMRIDRESPTGASHMYMYRHASHLTNSCKPNCVWNIGPFPDFKIRIRASVPIKRGQKLTVNRQGYLYLGSIQRQRILQDTLKKFCECGLCRDPTELGTMQSTIACLPCRENDPPKFGYLLPRETCQNSALEEKAEWKCNICQNTQPASSFLPRLNEIYKMVQKAQASRSKLVAQREIELVMKNGSEFLHPNHWIIQQAVSNPVACNADMLTEDGATERLQRLRPEFEQCVQYMSFLLNILDKTCPGIQHERVRILLLLGDAILMLCKDTFASPSFPSIDKEETLKLEESLQMSVQYLEEALLYWSGSPILRGHTKPVYVDSIKERIKIGRGFLEHVENKIYEFRKAEDVADIKIEDWGIRYKKKAKDESTSKPDTLTQ